MSGFSKIDLSALPAPDVVEALDYETVLADMLVDLRSRDTAYTAIVESDPAYKVLEVAAYRETILRQRCNEACRAVMVAYSLGADLDHLAALVPVARKVLDPGDDTATPPRDPVLESDTEFRRRVQLAPEGFSVAGPEGGYVYHALAATGVRDAAALSPEPGVVDVYVLGREGDGTPSADVLQAVDAIVNAREVRPLTDLVRVKAAVIVVYQVTAVVHVLPGPATASVLDAARASLATYTSSRHAMGLGAPLSGLYAALHVEGVAKVELASPTADVACAAHQAAWCSGVTLEAANG